MWCISTSLFLYLSFMNSSSIFLILYSIFSLVHLWAGQFGQPNIAFYTKPLLMLFLVSWFYFSTKNHPSTFRNLIIGALLFSFGGDTLLMFVKSHGEHFFLMGLGSFLLAHVCYLFGFYKYKTQIKGWLTTKPLLTIPLFILLLGFVSYLVPDIATAMQIPVVAYSLVIMGMVLSVLNLGGKINSNIFMTLLAGALLFMSSDMMIAVNKFKTPLPYAHIAIMLTYLLGQFFIVKSSRDLIMEGK